ncbi:MAG: glycosyl hydrolase, partial [Tannerella sp.]|nr:glycosyl hydrolase [Tannerella sp.]
MNKILFILTALTVIWSCTTNGGTDSLEQGFITPPDEARPGVYWYFMDGNLSADGMTKDLEAMRKAGIGHVLFLEVGIGIPRGKVDFLSEEWQTLFAHAVHECERLGIRMVLGIGPGWNGSGGPWVEGAQAMQHLVYTSVDVAGGKGEQSLSLPKPAPRKPFFGEGVFS